MTNIFNNKEKNDRLLACIHVYVMTLTLLSAAVSIPLTNTRYANRSETAKLR